MRRHATAATALATGLIATAASTTEISGTWGMEVDAWLLPDFPNIPTPPLIASATFSFDNSTTSEGNPGDFASNFGVTSVLYSYDPGLDSLVLDFFSAAGPSFTIQANFIDVSTHFIEPSVPPILHEVLFMPNLVEQIAAATFSGDFTPTPPAVPEPATWAMQLLGFAGIGFAARRRFSALAIQQYRRTLTSPTPFAVPGIWAPSVRFYPLGTSPPC